MTRITHVTVKEISSGRFGLILKASKIFLTGKRIGSVIPYIASAKEPP